MNLTELVPDSEQREKESAPSTHGAFRYQERKEENELRRSASSVSQREVSRQPLSTTLPARRRGFRLKGA